MRTLYILRHAEAVPASGVEDRDRALTQAGQEAMQRLAPLLAGMAEPPGIALCSPAVRTRQTQRTAAPALPVRIVEDMYDATPERLLQLVQGIDDSHRAALVVGHNPSIQALVLLLARAGDEQLRGLAAMSYKPGTLAVVQSHLPRWDAFGPDNATLVSLLVPPFAEGSGA